MKVAIIGNTPRPLNNPEYRGVERFTHGLARKLVERGHEVTLFSRQADLPCRVVPIVSRDESEMQGYLKAMRRIATEGFDVVHNNSSDTFPLLASSKLGSIMLTTLHAPPDEARIQLFNQPHPPVESYFCALSRKLRDQWSAKTNLGNIPVVPFGSLDFDQEVTLNLARQKNQAIWAGRIRPGDGLKHALKAATLAGVFLRFAGPILDQRYYREEILPLTRKGDRYLGNLSIRELRKAMETVDVGVASSDQEAAPSTAVTEMLAAGLPVVSFRSDSMKEIITSSNGRLARPGDVADLAKGIIEAGRLCKIKIQQRAIAKYSLEKMVLKYERIYKFLKVLHENNQKEKAYWHLYSSSKQRTLG